MGVGVGEAGVFPGMAKIAAEHFPSKERATATGCYLAGARLGYALTPVIMGFLIAQYNWRMAFYITGLGSLLFCVFWFYWYQDKKGSIVTETAPAAGTDAATAQPIPKKKTKTPPLSDTFLIIMKILRDSSSCLSCSSSPVS